MPRRLSAAAVLLLFAGACAAAPLEVTVHDAAGRALPDAVVFLESPAARAATRPLAGFEIAQEERRFLPEVAVVTLGTDVQFPNRDSVRHHVYSFSPAKTFDLKLYSGKPANPVVFDKPGPVALGCNIHDWMVGFVYVVESPWFAKTARTGTARIDLADGEYDLKVWHPWQRAELPAQRVKVGGAESQLTFKVDLNPPPKATPH